MDRIDSPEHAQPSHPLIGTTVGPYEILESIGIGAIGMVLKARLVNTEEFVALKLLPFDIDSTTIKRLEREAKVLSQLQHPNIVQVFDVRSTPTKQHFIVIEFIDGENLKEIIERDVILEVNRALPIFHQIADGMAFAHGKGVLHRDLKPHNIMLTNKPAVDFAKILDFGLAKLTQDSQELTRTGEILGSPVYMSPEQSQGTELDERSDIYSFGVLMYQTLTGSAPIRGSSAAETFALKLTKRPPPFIEVAPGLLVPDELEHVVMRCLEVNPDRRISSMRQVKTELENIERRMRDITADATGQAPQLKLSTRDTHVEGFLQSKPVVLDETGEHQAEELPPPPYMRSRVDPVISKRKMFNIVMLVAVTLFAIGVAATVGVTFLNKQAEGQGDAASTDSPTSESSSSIKSLTSDDESDSISEQGSKIGPKKTSADKTSAAGDDDKDSWPSDDDKDSGDEEKDSKVSDDVETSTASSSEKGKSTTQKASSPGGMSGGGLSGGGMSTSGKSGAKSSGGLSSHSGMSDSSERMPAPPSGVSSITESIPLTPKGMSALYQQKPVSKKTETDAPITPTSAKSSSSKATSSGSASSTSTSSAPTPVAPGSTASTSSTSSQSAPNQPKSATKPSQVTRSVPPRVEKKPVVADDVPGSSPDHSMESATTSQTKSADVPKKASRPKPKAKPRSKKKATPKPAATAEAQAPQPPRRRAYSTWQYYQERTRQGGE